MRPVRSLCPGWLRAGAGASALLLVAITGLAVGPMAAATPSAAVSLAGVDYIEAAAYAARFGLKSVPAPGEAKLILESKWHRLEFEAASRECRINGVRVFLGEPVRLHRGRWHFGRLDAEKLLTPILLPGADAPEVPRLRVIVLDPGHGGGDPGMRNTRLGLEEKTLALDTALRLKPLLEAQGYKVVLTRGDDRQLARSKADDLRARAGLTGEVGADLFISLHYNSVASGAERVSGVEVYTLTPQFQYSHSDSGRTDSTVGIGNLGNRHDHWNSLLGYTLQRDLVGGLKASDRGLKRGRLAVLRLASCPAVLVEAGFLSNDTEAAKIATPAYRQQIAAILAESVRRYAAMIEGVQRHRAAQP